jgi:peptidoglycan/LPS O-acetylase OafA/YrhL
VTVASDATVEGDTDLPPAADEAGTAPGDRRFRPDIQGLRAVAVLLVVLYHAGLRGLGGGYVGVDVFFVISGFVITGVLLRERESSDRTSLVSFYGRRSRRIIPAATIVIVVTVVLSYGVLGVVYGTQTAIDARWTAVFLANFHFSSVGTNYLTAQQPPSLLLNFWSLAVEEQFYVVYPTIFLVIAAVRTRMSLYARLTIGLVAIIVASFALSVFQTASDPTAAYFSPFTRAWELALGALVAVATSWLLQLPKVLGSVMTWAGLAAIAFAAIDFNGHTPYPGSLVAVPVLGTALVIAGGASIPPRAAESILGLGPFRWFGKLSYSIYLWHWPILIIAADQAGKASLPFRDNIVWLVVALAASVVTFSLVENPIRHATFPRLGRWAPIGLGVVLIAVSLGVSTVAINRHQGSGPPTRSAGHSTAPVHFDIASSDAEVEGLVSNARTIRSLPRDLTPSLPYVRYSWGGPPAPCWPAVGQSSIPACVFGDLHASSTAVLYGDSHAGMWLQAMNFIGIVAHWKIVYLGKGYCPADMLAYQNPPGIGRSDGEYAVCDKWHTFAIDRINRIHPDVVIITQEVRGKPNGDNYTPSQWQQGLENTFKQLDVPTSRILVLGNTPSLPQSGPQCLSRNGADVQACSAPNTSTWTQYADAEQAAATSAGARYISVIPWFCSTTCTAVIGKYEVYFDDHHITGAYSFFLSGVLSQALDLSAAN